MKFEVNQKDRSVIIALGGQIRREGLKPSLPDLSPDERFYDTASREELVSFAKMAVSHAIDKDRFAESMMTKLGLIISLLDGTADARLESSPIGEVDLFAEDIRLVEHDVPKLEGPVEPEAKKPRVYHPRKGLTGATHVAERVYRLDDEKMEALREAGFTVRELGEDVSEFYQTINSMIRMRVRRVSYTIKDSEGIETVITAKAPDRFLPKTKVGDLFLADVCHRKYAVHTPYNRTAQLLKLDGCNISRQDLDRYQMQIFERLGAMDGLFERKAQESRILYIDEVPTVTQGSKKKKNYVWIINNKGLAWYRYFEGRAGEGPLGAFNDWDGFCMSDAFSAYPAHLKKATLGICLAHVRRRYVDYRKVTGSEEVVKIPLDCFGTIYHEDGKLRTLLEGGEIDHARFLEERNRLCRPHLDTLKQWCEQCRAARYHNNTSLERAVVYTLNNWQRIEDTFANSEAEIDNNRSERLCKVVKLGSKNWITNGSFDGARSSALMYSLIETAKLYGLNARNYLAYVFMKGAASHNWEIPAEELEPLMPWNVKDEDLSIVTDEIDWLSRTMVPVQEWEERLAAEGDKR